MDDKFEKLGANIDLYRRSDEHDTDYGKLPGVKLRFPIEII